MPRGSRPSTPAFTSSGARKASEIVILACRMLHFSRAAICSTLVTVPATISSSQRRPRAIAATSVARVSARMGRRSCGGIDDGTMISRRRFIGIFVHGMRRTSWVYESAPAIISGARDDGNLPFHFEPPAAGGHLRIVQSDGKPADYDPAKDPVFKPLGATRLRPDGVWDRGGQNFFSSPVHKSATVDYGILLAGERTLILDRGNVVMKAGDVVVQLGNWHGWSNINGGSLMAFVMMGAVFDKEPKV